MLEIIGTIILIALAIFLISIMGLGLYVAYKMIKSILKDF